MKAHREIARPSRRPDLAQPLSLFAVASVVVVFLLLLIQVVVTPSSRRAGPERPFSSTARPVTESETDLTVYVLADGRLLLGRQFTPEHELAARLQELNARTPGRQLVLEADRAASYAKIEVVFRAARDAGFRDVRIMTGDKDRLEGSQGREERTN